MNRATRARRLSWVTAGIRSSMVVCSVGSVEHKTSRRISRDGTMHTVAGERHLNVRQLAALAVRHATHDATRLRCLGQRLRCPGRHQRGNDGDRKRGDADCQSGFWSHGLGIPMIARRAGLDFSPSLHPAHSALA
jgi:hypothetical protein